MQYVHKLSVKLYYLGVNFSAVHRARTVEVIEKIAPFASKRVLEYGTSLIASTFSPCTETARPFGILSQEQARQCDGLVGAAGARYGALVNHNNARIAF